MNGIEIDHLRVEYGENPLGIDVLRPRLSWALRGAANARKKKQTAYQIQVAENESDLLEETGMV